jgi:hypothetical protein
MSSLSEKAKSIISTVAPLLGTALGGPLGGMAGTLISQALGVKPGDDKALEAAITSGNPDLLLQLKNADQAFSVKMEELGIQREQLEFQDTANARGREIALHDNTPKILAYAITAGFFGVLAAMLFGVIPKEGHDALLVMLGSLGTAWAGITTYYYGSSASSKRKDDALVSIAKG